MTPVLRLWDYMVNAVAAAFGELLETRHLYQSVAVKVELEKVDPSTTLQRQGSRLLNADWRSLGPGTSVANPLETWERQGNLMFHPPSIRFFCVKCDRREPANVMEAQACATAKWGSHLDAKESVQDFVISYECQGCHGPWESFLIRRQGLKLTLCGRSPMEHVEVARFIPKLVREFFSGAQLAHNSGQTLAANFLLRTVIEQWARPYALDVKGGGDAVKAYTASLPQDFKGRFPSLSEVYDRLSVDIHSAAGAVDVFCKSLGDIERHFEARRLFELPGPPTAGDAGGSVGGA